MGLRLGEFNDFSVRNICDWKYEGEYAIYNFPSYEKVINKRWNIIERKRWNREFFSVVNEKNILCGYIRLQNKKDYILIGIALKPELCGKELGRKVISLIKKKSEKMYGYKSLQLEVRDFNKRAIKCYEKEGFKEIERYDKNSKLGIGTFIRMEFNREK